MYYISHMVNTLPSPHTYTMHPHYQVLVGILIVLMFSLNVAFIVDLTINHQAHSKHSYNVTAPLHWTRTLLSPTALHAYSLQAISELSWGITEGRTLERMVEGER